MFRSRQEADTEISSPTMTITTTARSGASRRLRGDLEVDVDLAGERGLQLAGTGVQHAQALDAGAEDRQRVRRWVGLGELVELGGTSTASR